jgi:molybdopterin converting factor small subunit
VQYLVGYILNPSQPQWRFNRRGRFETHQMRVRIRFLGSLRPANALGEIERELPVNSKMIDLINSISNDYPEVAVTLRNPAKNLIMLDGIEVGNIEGLETSISNGSEVVLVPITHGG